MDPFAITCTVITLATALKDLIELGIKLKEFCEKVAENDRKLARLCAQILSDLQELERLYCSNHNVMDQSLPLRDSVIQLILKLRSIVEKLEILVETQPKANLFARFKSAFKASSVEASIGDLTKDISICYRSFQLLATARIESTIQKTHIVVQELLVLSKEQRQEIQAMKSRVQQQLQSYDTSVVISSSQTTVWKTSQSRTLACLEEQIDNIGAEVSKRTAAGYTNLPRRPVKPFTHSYLVLSYHHSPEKRYRALLRQVLDLLKDLEFNAATIDDYASTLNILGVALYDMKMRHEANIVYSWAIDFYRILIKLRPDDFAPHLAQVLYNRGKKGDLDEAIKIFQPIAIGLNSSPHVRCQSAAQLALRIKSPGKGVSREDRLKDAECALASLEPTLRAEAKFIKLWTLLDDHANLVDHYDSLLANPTQSENDAPNKPDGFITSDFELTGAEAVLYTYSIALQCAFQAHHDLGLANTAERFLLKAVIIRCHLAATYPDTDLEAYLAYLLPLFPDDILPPERKLQYLEEAIKILRKATSFDPKLYTDNLLDTLSKKANWHGRMGRREEALQTWREMLESAPTAALAHRAQSGRSIEYKAESNTLRSYCRVEDVIVLHVQSVEIYYQTFNTYSFQQARACRTLATNYQLAGYNKHALQLADLAVQQFQTLALKDPSKFTAELASTLLSWIDLHPSLEFSDSQATFEKVKPTLDHYEDLVHNNINNLQHYDSLLSSLVSGVDNLSLARLLSHELIERLRRLAEVHPEAENVGMTLLERKRDHALLLYRWDLLSEAAAWLGSLRDEHHHLASSDEKIGSWYICLLLNLAMVLKDKGDLMESRAVLQQAVETGKQLTDLDMNTTWWNLLALEYRAEIAGFLGEDALALSLSVECVSSALSHPLLQGIADIPVALLPPHSRQLAINGRYDEALDSIAIEKMGDPSKYDQHPFIWFSEYLRTWATCLTDTHKTSEALAIAQQAVEEAKRARKATASSTCSKTSESVYGSALWTLGYILLLSNDRNGALLAFEEVKELWKQRSKVRRFDLRNLGLTLWALGKVYCLHGRYEDGVAANQKLRKILNGLESSNTTMHRVVSVAIDQERRRPSWVKFLGSVADELKHGHLEEVVPKMQRA